MRILLTAIGGPAGICFAKSLRELSDIHIVGTSAEEDSFGRPFTDSFHIVPLASDERYLERMREIVRDDRIDWIVPLVDDEIIALSREDVGCRILVSPPETIRYTTDKVRAYDVYGDFLPRRHEPPHMPFPVFAKLRVGRGGKGARLVRDARDLAGLEEGRYLFQEVLDEPEVSVDTIFDLDGNLLAAAPRERTRIDQGISITGRAMEAPALMEVIGTIASRLRFVGPVNFQFMRRGDTYVLIEINARGSGGLGISIRAGIDVPKLAYAVMAGTRPEHPVLRPGEYENFEEVLARQYRKKQLSHA